MPSPVFLFFKVREGGECVYEDRLWPGGPELLQPESVKLTTDTVLLADFAEIRIGQKGADLGCSSGALMILLMQREAGLRMTGLELDPAALKLAQTNFRINGMEERAKLISGDMRQTACGLPNAGFDFVISNPPYFPPESGIQSPVAERAAARSGEYCGIEDICRIASRLCRSGGKSFFSYRPERLMTLLTQMTAYRLQPKRIRFVHYKPSSKASIVLVEGRKDGKESLAVEAPLILCREDGTESAEYRRIYHRI